MAETSAAETAAAVQESTPEQRPRSAKDEEVEATPDVNSMAMKMVRAREAYKAYGEVEEKPSKGEVLSWYLYGLCTYFIQTVLIPIVFPIIISQAMSQHKDVQRSFQGLNCTDKENKLYGGLTSRSIMVNELKFSPLHWTSISWVTGLILAAPILSTISTHLDYGHNQQLIAGAATAIGALFCLPAGLFKTTWIFPPYIAIIVAANTIGTASHARHLGLMVRGFTGSSLRITEFSERTTVASWFSCYATAAGSLGSAIISAFTYHMLRKSDSFTNLWIVSIFSGLKWFVGILHIFVASRLGRSTNSLSSPIPRTHVISIFKYPHAAGSLAVVFLSAFTAMCIFTGGLLYSVGRLCLNPVNVLYVWLTYFIFPLVSLPVLLPFGKLIRADADKMQLLGFLLSTLTSGFGFYFHNENWNKNHIILFAAFQSTATGLLHAFGRVLLLDCTPAGKEGAFSVWFSWVRALGTCAGFAIASAFAGNIKRSFGVAFCAAIVGIVVSIFGNISSFGGAMAAGHVRAYDEMASPMHSDGGGVIVKEPANMETTYDRNIEV